MKPSIDAAALKLALAGPVKAKPATLRTAEKRLPARKG